jgi:carbon-monoxide dehydrogenase medium subunit
MGGNLCNASPAADSVPALIAAAAKAVIAGSGGTREVPVEEIVTGPGQTSLGPDEFVVQIILPKPPTRAGDAYLRFIPRTEMDIAVVGAGVSLSLNDDGTCAAVRMALGAVAPTVVLVEAASDILVGKNLDDAVLDALASAASGVCNPIDDKRGTIEFRTKVAGVLARRVTTIAWQRAEKS